MRILMCIMKPFLSAYPPVISFIQHHLSFPTELFTNNMTSEKYLYFAGPKGELYKTWVQNLSCQGNPTPGVEYLDGFGTLIDNNGQMNVVKYSMLPPSVSFNDFQAYNPRHPRNLALSAIKGFRNSIEFTAKRGIRIDSILKNMNSSMRFFDSSLISFYQDYVLWSYKLRLTRLLNNDFSLTVVSVGSTLGEKIKKKKNGKSYPSTQKTPSIIDANIHAIDPYHNEPTQLEWETLPDGGLSCSKLFTIQDLLYYTNTDDGEIHFSFSAIISRFFFSINSIIDVEEDDTEPKSSVHKILNGHKPRGADWEITGSVDCCCCDSGSPIPIYSVHLASFTKTSKAVNNLQEDISKMMESITCFEGFTDQMLRLAIEIAYEDKVSLPRKGTYVRHLYGRLREMFGDHFTSVVIPQWEIAICRVALDLNKHSPSSSMVELLHLINIIWECPCGSFPIAKNVAIGVLADMAHVNAKTSVQQWVQDEVIPHLKKSCIECEHIPSILAYFWKLMDSVEDVKKKGRTETNNNEEIPSSAVK
ncbi:hypothetical protein PRIPAC_95104 [Pristionchus pacificus]|uniref:Uncharacterized protein n=1 Tax=Pristionchus pacificus TaxID=54126 RepID=A0A2A6BPA8_PRIPA|nr:hypothetical protein PRIPAC_95104 [Pristionchus pacificus]|eukprot:PDM67755.1 hypothetical protein PRIPAC_45799 [Pristionchus pacificus]